MAFASNDNQQLTLTDSTLNLTQREKRFLEKSWAKTFAEKVFPAIDESIFSVLYSDKAFPSQYSCKCNRRGINPERSSW